MSYQEKRAIVSLISTLLISVSYFGYALQKYPDGNPYSPEVFRFWGSAIVILIPVTIVANIIIHIVFSIINTVTTKEEEPAILDERDKSIELKATRNSLYVFMIGFMLAMGALVIDMPPSVMFVVLITAGVLSSIVSDISHFYFYRRGF